MREDGYESPGLTLEQVITLYLCSTHGMYAVVVPLTLVAITATFTCGTEKDIETYLQRITFT